MTYVREKRAGERVVYQLVEGRRENGKVRQKVLAHLGKYPTPRLALARWERWIVRYRCAAARLEGDAESKLELMRKDEDEKDEARCARAARVIDEDGNMRRRKYAPHELSGAQALEKDTKFRNQTHRSMWFHGLYTVWQAEYWAKVDHAALLRREADRLEGRSANLCVVLGECSEEEARERLRARQQRHEEAHARNARIKRAAEERRERKMGLAAHRIAAEALGEKNPMLAMQLGLAGYTGPPPCPHCNGTGLAPLPDEAQEED